MMHIQQTVKLGVISKTIIAVFFNSLAAREPAHVKSCGPLSERMDAPGLNEPREVN
jgi:hypothetical protein